MRIFLGEGGRGKGGNRLVGGSGRGIRSRQQSIRGGETIEN